MAEALLEHVMDGAVWARSAGSHPKALDRGAVRAIREHGIDLSELSGRRPKHVSECAGQRSELLITLCD